MDVLTIVRRIGAMWGGVLLTLVLCTGACSTDSDPDPVAYFEGFEEAQAELDEVVGALFDTPAARQLDEFLDEEAPAQLDPAQDAVVRQFVAEFWTGAADATETHLSQMNQLEVPDSVRSDHDAYVDALEAMIDSRDTQVARAESTSGVELLATFWQASPEIEAINDTCSVLVGQARDHGVSITTSICDDQ